jgi:hypothetical protein
LDEDVERVKIAVADGQALRLGRAVLDQPFYCVVNPGMLARSLL